MKKIKVAVVFGGVSTEHEVSRCSASSIIRELDYEIFDIAVMEISKKNEMYIYDEFNLDEKSSFCCEIKKTANNLGKRQVEFGKDFICKENIDVIFPVLHGLNGEDGTFQGFIEICGIPYVGCGVLSSALCMDKAMAKIILNNACIPQARHLCFTCEEINKDIKSVISSILDNFSYPVFIKPSNSGSSVGVSKAKNNEQLAKALALAAKLDRKVLIEEAIKGRELECAVLGDYSDALASRVGEVIASNEFYDYNAKYVDNKSITQVPADIGIETENLIREFAVNAFKALDCYGLARVDFFLKDDNTPVLNEINTLPGFTDISMYPMLMCESGIPYKELITRLIKLALYRKEKYSFSMDYEEVMRNEK